MPEKTCDPLIWRCFIIKNDWTKALAILTREHIANLMLNTVRNTAGREYFIPGEATSYQGKGFITLSETPLDYVGMVQVHVYVLAKLEGLPNNMINEVSPSMP